jgi:CRP-like cAMP-binding protein
VELGRAAEDAQCDDDALRAYREATRLSPQDPEAWALLGDVAARKGASEEAANAHYQVCELYARGAMPREGLRHLAVVLALSPAHGPALSLRSQLERKTGLTLSSLTAFAGAPTLADPPSHAQGTPTRPPRSRPPTGVPDQRPLIAEDAPTEVVELEAESEEPTFTGGTPTDRDRPAVPRAEALRLIADLVGQSPLLAALDSNTVRTVVEDGTLVRHAAGEIIVKEGDPGGGLHLILDGEVAVLRGRLEVARLRAGAFFGEASLITALPRNASVKAVGEVTLLEVPRATVRALTDSKPRVLEVLTRFFRARLVASLLVTSPLFEPFSPEDRKQLVGAFRMREVAPGDAVLSQGERTAGLFVLLAGTLEVVKPAPAGVLGDLAPGDVFGEMSLLDDAPAMATVRAASRAWVLLLPREAFAQLSARYPALPARLHALAETRKARNKRR